MEILCYLFDNYANFFVFNYWTIACNVQLWTGYSIQRQRDYSVQLNNNSVKKFSYWEERQPTEIFTLACWVLYGYNCS